MNVFALESKRDFIGLRYKVYTVKMMSYVLLFILCVCVCWSSILPCRELTPLPFCFSRSRSASPHRSPTAAGDWLKKIC